MELLAPPPASAPRIAASEELGALPLFQLYAAHVAMPDQARAAGAAILQARNPRVHMHAASGRLLQHFAADCSVCDGACMPSNPHGDLWCFLVLFKE